MARARKSRRQTLAADAAPFADLYDYARLPLRRAGWTLEDLLVRSVDRGSMPHRRHGI
jgi:hypothetical protein